MEAIVNPIEEDSVAVAEGDEEEVVVVAALNMEAKEEAEEEGTMPLATAAIRDSSRPSTPTRALVGGMRARKAGMLPTDKVGEPT